MTLLPARKSLTPTGDPNTYYNKGETDALLSGKASTDLTNLSSTGQMIIDSANGTISNCVLEIPQNIKLTLENNVLTLKSGSILTWGGSTYVTSTTTSDKTWTPTSSEYNKTGLIFSARINGAIQGLKDFNKILSGSTAQRPAWSISQRDNVYYDVDTKTFYYATTSEWIDWAVAYPLCAVEVDSEGNVTFAKDSNGNNMIFNGVGFVGHHIFRLPNVSGYSGEGFTSGGKLNSNYYKPQNLLIQEMSSGNPTYGKRTIGFQSVTKMNYIEVDTVAESPAHQHISWIYTYVKEQNQIFVWTGTVLVKQHESPLVYYTYNGTIVTDFTIRQPYQGARNLLTDDIDEQVKQNASDISTKQTDLTTVSGYDATTTQVLKHINGVLTWVTEE